VITKQHQRTHLLDFIGFLHSSKNFNPKTLERDQLGDGVFGSGKSFTQLESITRKLL